jgi:hypothetical protein
MISRCPSCGAQVDDEAQQCPKCYWDFIKFKRIPPPGQALPEKEPAPPPTEKDFTPEPELPASAFAAPAAQEPPPEPAPEPEPEPAPRPAPVQLPPIGNAGVPQLPAAPPPAAPGLIAARPASGNLAMPMFGKIPEHPPLAPGQYAIPSLPAAPGPARPLKRDDSPPRAASPIPPAIPKAPAAAPKPAQPPAEKKVTVPPQELPQARTPRPAPAPSAPPPRPARSEQPPLTVIQSGSWGSTSVPRPPAAKPGAGQPATVQPKAARGRSPLLNRVTAGVVAAGVLFVIATQFVMRSDVEVGGRRSALPSFAKDSRPQPLQLPMPAVPLAGAVPSTAAAVSPLAEPVRVSSAPAVAAPAAPAAAPAPAAAKPAAAAPPPPPAAPPKPKPAPKPARVAAKPRPKPAARPKEEGPQWSFSGSTYDLISLRPVFAATLAFKDPSGKVCGEATTAEDGSYSISLAPLSEAGYVLSVRHSDYQDRTIDEINPPFKEVSLEERRQLVSMAARARPWIGSTSQTVRRDFVMIPKNPVDKGDPESPAAAGQ